MTAIGPGSFPTPDLALRSDDPAEERRVRGFAREQASAAEAARARLAAIWPDASAARRDHALRRVHAELVRWRYELALRAPGRIGTGIALDAERFRARMDEHGPNYDRLGHLGRLRAGPSWDPSTRTFRGGRDTPAHRIMLAYGRAAAARFEHEGVTDDVLHNEVVLPDGSRVGGNRLVRGAAARAVTDDLVARIARRGADTSQIETGGEPYYVVSATDPARATLFDAAMALLASAPPGDVAAWQCARYLLYQAPLTKKGSDAVTRTFLVAVGTVLLGRPPTMEQDADLRCAVLGQAAATTMPSDPAPSPLTATGRRRHVR